MHFLNSSFRAAAALCFGSLCLGYSSLMAAAPQGTFVLVEEGAQGNSSYAMLGQLTVDGAGAVKGFEMLRASGVVLTADLTGKVTMDTEKSGVLALTATEQNATEPREFLQTYRFLVTADNTLRAVRIDPGIVSEAAVTPSNALPQEGAFVLSESDKGASILAQITLGASGTVSGKALLQQFGTLVEVSVGGTYQTSSTAMGTLTLTYSMADQQGEVQDFALRYTLLSTKAEGLKAIRLDSASAAITDLAAQ